MLVALATFATTLLGLAAPAQAADPAHDPVLNCSFRGVVGNDVVFAGEAHSPVIHVPAVSMRLTCTARSFFGPAYSITSTNPGPVAVVRASAPFWYGPFYLCESGTATYADGHVATVPERCDETVDLGPLLEGSHTAPRYADCQHTRSPATTYAWLLAATGRAPVGPAGGVPLTTEVSCTLTDTNGESVTVSGTQLGPVATATGGEQVVVAPLASKCVTVTVTFLEEDDSAWSETYCEDFLTI